MSSAAEQSRNTLCRDPPEERRRQRDAGSVLRERYKWRTLASTSVISVILAGILPSLGVLLYYDLKDKQVSLRAAVKTPIYYIVSWCIADSWSQTAYTTTYFKKIAVATSFISALSIIVNFTFHDTMESIGSQYLLGIVAGSGARLMMTTCENLFSEYYSARSAWTMGFRLLVIHSMGLVLVPSLVAFVAETEGIHYGTLTLGVLVLQTLPAVMLLRKPQIVPSSRRLYLTNQPAYALLHNENDDSDEQLEEEAETSLSQLNYGAIPTPQHTDDAISSAAEIQQTVTPGSRNEATTDDNAVPLFTNIDLVAGTYEGDVAFSFEDTPMSESPRYDRSELFFRAVARRRQNEQIQRSRCCAFSITPALNQELNRFKQPALYLGFISIIAQIYNAITILILLPSLTNGFHLFHIQHHSIEFPSVVGAAFVTIIIGMASAPVILVPITSNYFSHFGRKLSHGIETAIAAVCVYGIGRRLPEFSIIVLISFGLNNAISIGTFEPLLKEILLGKHHYKGHKSCQEEWGKIRGLANTVVGLTVLLTAIVVDFLIEDWDIINWSLLYFTTAAIQMFAGIAWILTPTNKCHCLS